MTVVIFFIALSQIKKILFGGVDLQGKMCCVCSTLLKISFTLYVEHVDEARLQPDRVEPVLSLAPHVMKN
jgi:hypothetical protein